MYGVRFAARAEPKLLFADIKTQVRTIAAFFNCKLVRFSKHDVKAL